MLTSNLASDNITQMCANGEIPAQEVITEAIRPVLSNHFKPALLARMQIVPFFPIAGDAMKDIVKLKLDRLAERLLQSHKMAFIYAPAVVDQIAQRCTEVETGARNVDHIINRTLLPRISTELLGHMSMDIQPDTLTLGMGEDGDFIFGFRGGIGD
jgi:type VI secretion system protein VasG